MAENPVMSPAESLMWTVERDPILRSTFMTITMLDRAPDMGRLEARIGDAMAGFPRMRQRVRTATSPLERHRWIDDASFDLRYHIRRVALAPPGTQRALMDLAALWLEDAFDPVRPLWQLTVVEGLDGGRAALFTKMHHTITDGVGGLRLSSSFLDFDQAGEAPVRAAPTEEDPAEPARSGATGALNNVANLAASAGRALRPDRLVRQVRGAADGAVSVLRQGMGGASASSLWEGRSMGRWLDCIDLSLDTARVVSKDLGGTINDYFVSGVTGGAARYHRAMGAEVDTLRVAMPVSTRVDASFGGNSFAPARVTVPAGIADPAERFRAIHSLLSAARSDPAIGFMDSVATLLMSLPPAVLTPLARQQIAVVDLAASNLRGSPVQLFVGGAAVLANYPMGPTAGVAFNTTVLSYMSRLDLGLDVDVAAVADPPLLRTCIEESFQELDSLG
ncbi:MAG: wax ester/triacylglycerol synthase domain-containing protein [Acidimicrobiales bacterium]